MLLNPPPSHPYRGAVMVLVGVGAVMAAAAFLVVLLSPASQPPLTGPTTETLAAVPLTTLAGPGNAVPAAAQAAGHSIVELRATTAHGTVTMIGVAVAEGGIVATTADLLTGAQHLFMVGPDGKLQPASVVAWDTGSDVALVDVPEDLPVATFSDDAGLSGGTPDLTLSFVSAGGTSLALHCTAGAVTGVGRAIADGPAGGMPSITSTPAVTAAGPGDPLLDASGAVVGILYEPGPGSASSSAALTFLPSDLVVGVADDLRSNDRVVHGWLGVSGTDAPGGTGAKVVQVQPAGPAARARVAVGQVVVAVNGLAVRTMAELRARLYVLTPGTIVDLSLQSPGTPGTKVVDVTLGSSS